MYTSANLGLGDRLIRCFSLGGGEIKNKGHLKLWWILLKTLEENAYEGKCSRDKFISFPSSGDI